MKWEAIEAYVSSLSIEQGHLEGVKRVFAKKLCTEFKQTLLNF